jgi:hypothetical protein
MQLMCTIRHAACKQSNVKQLQMPCTLGLQRASCMGHAGGLPYVSEPGFPDVYKSVLSWFCCFTQCSDTVVLLACQQLHCQDAYTCFVGLV